MGRHRGKTRGIDTGYDSEPLSVLHVSTPMSWRGGEQQLAYLFEALERKGVQQSLLCPSGSALERYSEESGWPKLSFRRKGPLAIGVARELARSAKTLSPDLVHVHDSHAHTAAFIASLFFRFRVPIIVHRRVDFPIGKSFFSRRKYDHPQVKRVIAVSEAIRSIGTQDVKVPEKWVVVHSGIDPERMSERRDPERLRKELGVEEGVPLIGNVAALADHKDHMTFLRTAREFFERGGKGRFVLIGDGPERGSVEAGIKRMGLEEKVFLLGFREDVPELLSGMDLFLMSSKTEGLGTSVLDAMAASVPVLSTNAGGIPEIVQDGVNGVLRGVGDHKGSAEALLKLLDDPSLRKSLALKGRETAEANSFSRMADAVLAIYHAGSERPTSGFTFS